MVAPLIAAALPSMFEIGKQIITKLFPDPAEAARQTLELAKLEASGQLAELDASVKLAEAQAQINAVEASSPNMWQAGWRPFIGWICGAGLAYQFIGRPLLNFLLLLLDHVVLLPPLELDTLMTLLFGMLGLGAYRTYEKKLGVAR